MIPHVLEGGLFASFDFWQPTPGTGSQALPTFKGLASEAGLCCRVHLSFPVFFPSSSFSFSISHPSTSGVAQILQLPGPTQGYDSDRCRHPLASTIDEARRRGGPPSLWDPLTKLRGILLAIRRVAASCVREQAPEASTSHRVPRNRDGLLPRYSNKANPRLSFLAT